jgi:hypothetical protein
LVVVVLVVAVQPLAAGVEPNSKPPTPVGLIRVVVVCPHKLPIPATKIARVSITVLKYKTDFLEAATFVLFSFEFFQTVHLRLF